MKNLVVIGLGYVGLPLAREACRNGIPTVGLDSNEAVVAGLNSGSSRVDDVSESDVKSMLSRGFTATTDVEVLREAQTVVICVPTPLTSDAGPDLTAVIDALTAIAPRLAVGTLVVLESTTYPGTTEEIALPILESYGLRVGEDFHLAFSPERIDPGNGKYSLKNTPKVVGGVTSSCTERAAKFYRALVDEVIVARGTREAELAKLLENTYRHINIALINEMAKFCHDLEIDIWDAIRCASTKPFGFQPFYPGPGVGGHCIPIDPNYLSSRIKSKLGYQFKFVELAQEINNGMPEYICRRIQSELNERSMPLRGSRILLLGLTYKANIADRRESPADSIYSTLVKNGAIVSFHDPYVEVIDIDGCESKRCSDLDLAISESDLTVLLQAHNEYDLNRLPGQAKQVLDTRGVVPAQDNVKRL